VRPKNSGAPTSDRTRWASSLSTMSRSSVGAQRAWARPIRTSRRPKSRLVARLKKKPSSCCTALPLKRSAKLSETGRLIMPSSSAVS